MPLVRLQTSLSITSEQQQEVAAELSANVAKLLSKPETYMMVIVDANTPMLMGARSDPAALLELRSVGTVSPEQARALSKAFAEILGAKLDLPADRIYAHFMGVDGAMWGYNGGTFG